MIKLIIGTPDSGKSKLAEEMAIQLSGTGARVYIATMIPYGTEGEARVARHRQMREGKGFVTLERPVDVGGLIPELSGYTEPTCLLECLSNLVGNEMHDSAHVDDTDSELTDHIRDSVLKLASACKHLIVVSNEFDTGDGDYDDDTIRYIRLCHMVNEALASGVDEVIRMEKTTDEDN